MNRNQDVAGNFAPGAAHAHFLIICLMSWISVASAEYVIPAEHTPQVARAMDEDQMRKALVEAGRRLVRLRAEYEAEHTAYTNINAYVSQAERSAAEAQRKERSAERRAGQLREQIAIAEVLTNITADTRAHIPETATMRDAEIAALYLAQMAKEAPPLVAAAPTNTIEYAIGVGMRLDLLSGDVSNLPVSVRE